MFISYNRKAVVIRTLLRSVASRLKNVFIDVKRGWVLSRVSSRKPYRIIEARIKVPVYCNDRLISTICNKPEGPYATLMESVDGSPVVIINTLMMREESWFQDVAMAHVIGHIDLHFNELMINCRHGDSNSCAIEFDYAADSYAMRMVDMISGLKRLQNERGIDLTLRIKHLEGERNADTQSTTHRTCSYLNNSHGSDQ